MSGQCSRCGAAIDAASALYSEEGDVLCSACSTMAEIEVGESRAGASIFAASGGAILFGFVGIGFNPCLFATILGVASGIATWVQILRHPEYAQHMGWKKNASLVVATIGIVLALLAPVLQIALPVLLAG